MRRCLQERRQHTTKLAGSCGSSSGDQLQVQSSRREDWCLLLYCLDYAELLQHYDADFFRCAGGRPTVANLGGDECMCQTAQLHQWCMAELLLLRVAGAADNHTRELELHSVGNDGWWLSDIRESCWRWHHRHVWTGHHVLCSAAPGHAHVVGWRYR